LSCLGLISRWLPEIDVSPRKERWPVNLAIEVLDLRSYAR
jgi:hypothetical protein